ncbi:hypothetical protein K469DRAFT_367707 [Zopfia rhizophila CBS 207.26]|uniref:Uncharacterized protein n=1 Tax=Zopfia rhizophila CBS 207.26 TaxID=1314779 RepID=A0A6A6EHT1_9PEZI|nr:hypothetical protein K469DRAFT_367707 [Zopfia rhizophila CBS 207.26]
MCERLQVEQDRDAEDQPDEARLAWIERMHLQESVKWLKALLAWIEREFPQIAVKYAPSSQDSPSNGDNQDQDQVVLPYSKPSPSEPRRKASPSEMAGKSTRRKGEFARKRSALSQVQSSKVSKPVQRRRRPLDQKLSTTRHGVWPPEGHVNDVGQVEEQELSKVAVRRSERISRRTRDPAPPSPGLVRPKKSSQRLPDSTVRRSARILDRNKKIRSLGPDLDVKPAPSSMAAGQKSTRRTIVHTNAAYSGTPQGISKTRRWKATSRRSNV